jgi:nitrogen fixation/metabolism regulation signal transduction histidine kinase
MDVNMPVAGGVEGVRAIRGAGYATKIVMLTVSEDDDDLFDAIRAGAKHVGVSLTAENGTVTLAVMDDGTGFDPGRLEEALDHGFGLASMRERVEQIGGTLNLHTAPGMGTRVVVELQQEEMRAAHATGAPRPAR